MGSIRTNKKSSILATLKQKHLRKKEIQGNSEACEKFQQKKKDPSKKNLHYNANIIIFNTIMSKRFSPVVDYKKTLVELDLDLYEKKAIMIESPIGEYVLYSAHINTVDQFNKLKIKHDKLKEENN